jgi:hypothetical protein
MAFGHDSLGWREPASRRRRLFFARAMLRFAVKDRSRVSPLRTGHGRVDHTPTDPACAQPLANFSRSEATANARHLRERLFNGGDSLERLGAEREPRRRKEHEPRPACVPSGPGRSGDPVESTPRGTEVGLSLRDSLPGRRSLRAHRRRNHRPSIEDDGAGRPAPIARESLFSRATG